MRKQNKTKQKEYYRWPVLAIFIHFLSLAHSVHKTRRKRIIK